MSDEQCQTVSVPSPRIYVVHTDISSFVFGKREVKVSKAPGDMKHTTQTGERRSYKFRIRRELTN